MGPVLLLGIIVGLQGWVPNETTEHQGEIKSSGFTFPVTWRKDYSCFAHSEKQLFCNEDHKLSSSS